MDILVRDSREVDLPELVDIYNQSIAGAWSTADSKAISVSEWLDWYGKHNPEKRPLWVAEINAQIVAWIGLRSFHKGGGLHIMRRLRLASTSHPHLTSRALARSLKKE
ncbi:GNAT family N-acetyltransferase [Pseudomonas sp. NPDC079086]|uniref:GNAT family N-acetyltransferase n=1 Tax=unclassified Pseudomonas TaxID=196821 RepID=UPI0037C643CE